MPSSVNYTPRREREFALAAARENFLSTGDLQCDVPEQIAHSWHRSATWGVDPDRASLPYDPEFDEESALRRAAGPVLDRLAECLSELPMSVLLADRDARIIDRRVGHHRLLDHLDRVQAAEGFLYAEDKAGTNGVGTAIELRRTVRVVGDAHFTDRLRGLACVGTPIINPVTSQLEGILDVTCPAQRSSEFLTPLVENAAAEIRERFFLERTAEEQALLRHFLRAARSATGGITVVGERLVISNPIATRLLGGVDHGLLWEQAGRAIRTSTATSQQLDLPDGRSLAVSVTPLDEGTTVGALVELRDDDPLNLPKATGSRKKRRHQPLPEVAGYGTTWLSACGKARSALEHGDRVLLYGEPGVGKRTIINGLHKAFCPKGQLVMVDAATAFLYGTAAWLVGLRERIRHGPVGMVAVTHLELLAPPALQGLEAVLAEAEQERWLVAGNCAQPDVDEIDVLSFSAVRVEVPPLRDHLDDLPDLIEMLLDHLIAKDPSHNRVELAPEVIQTFQRLTWPGNVRQLHDVLASLVARDQVGRITLRQIPEEILRGATRRPLTRYERAEIHAILAALEESGGNRKEAARLLGISRSTLYRKLQSVGVDLDNTTF